MTSKADYTEQEWVRLRRAPFVAGLAISIADPGGPIELAKETIATLRATSTPPSQEELLVAVSQEIASMVNQKQNPMAGFKPDSSALAGKMILDELTGVNEILTAKATPEEADAFRRGCWPPHRPRPTPRRRAVSWGSVRSSSVRASSGCSVSSAKRSERPKPDAPPRRQLFGVSRGRGG